MRRPLFLTAIVALLMVVWIAPAAATPPTEMHMEVETSLLGDPSPFVASGQAVTDGLVCEEGLMVNLFVKVTGNSPTGFNVQGINEYICEDSSGSFIAKMQARIDFRKGTTFNWTILGGTGAYENLHGAGKGVGLYACGEDCVLDVYDGGVHIDP